MDVAISAASAKPWMGAVKYSHMPTGSVPAFSIILPSPSMAALYIILLVPSPSVTTADVGTNHVNTATTARKIITMVTADGILNALFLAIRPVLSCWDI